MKTIKVKKMKREKRIIDELCALLNLKNAAEFSRKSGVGNSTLSNLNHGKSYDGVMFGYELALAAIEELSKAKRKKIFHKMEKGLDKDFIE